MTLGRMVFVTPLCTTLADAEGVLRVESGVGCVKTGASKRKASAA